MEPFWSHSVLLSQALQKLHRLPGEHEDQILIVGQAADGLAAVEALAERPMSEISRRGLGYRSGGVKSGSPSSTSRLLSQTRSKKPKWERS